MLHGTPRLENLSFPVDWLKTFLKEIYKSRLLIHRICHYSYHPPWIEIFFCEFQDFEIIFHQIIPESIIQFFVVQICIRTGETQRS